jgi:hypothetical protein
MKPFLTYTAIIEALTGMGLIFLPARVVSLISGFSLTGGNAIIMSMVAGAAILSVALLSWLSRKDVHALMTVRVLLFYNSVIFVIFLYGAVSHDLKGPVLWLVLIFHFIQTIAAIFIMRLQKADKNTRTT